MNTAVKLLLVKPSSFGSNPETLENNAFQKESDSESSKISEMALKEFKDMTERLIAEDFELMVLDEPIGDDLPDSVFPNNWFSTQPDGQLILYPMFSALRRKERREDFINAIQKANNYNFTLDLTEKEKRNIFLEGTGSIVFDHNSRMAYCCNSPRSDEKLFKDLMKHLSYEGIFFNAFDQNKTAVYHTNVMMSIGDKKAIVCRDSIAVSELKNLCLALEKSNKQIIDISLNQMNSFAGNLLYARNKHKESFWLMSETALESFNADQIKPLKEDARIMSFSIPTIEKYGGGSVRCMMAVLY